MGKADSLVAITGGGTGGHIFPNIAVIEELLRRNRTRVLWIGQKGGNEEEWARRIGVPYYGIRSGKLRRYLSIKNAFDVFHVLIGTVQSFFILRKKRPDILFSKGGFVSVPPVIASGLLGVPIITHESDITPGLATRIIARYASVVCVSFEKSRVSVPRGRLEYTGNPVREAVKQGEAEAGRSFLGFEQQKRIVTIIGGSQGASSLNNAVWEMITYGEPPFNLVHQCGPGNIRAGYDSLSHYRQFEFIGREIGDVLAASDFIVSRAGAGALYEIGFMAKPSLLIPLPRTGSRGEQVENARFFQENGASDVLRNEELNGKSLYDRLSVLLTDERRLDTMGKRARALCPRTAETKIVDIIEEFLS
jgi:UDP-N-acetylglucosamine--N-acetylmuramyl-(pentapeptide) pyrophosphoryl-undecaprenol N-acetylglucosamine transferase